MMPCQVVLHLHTVIYSQNNQADRTHSYKPFRKCVCLYSKTSKTSPKVIWSPEQIIVELLSARHSQTPNGEVNTSLLFDLPFYCIHYVSGQLFK